MPVDVSEYASNPINLNGPALTRLRDNAGEDDLGLAGGLDGGAELLIVPGVDLALALDERRIRVHVENFPRQGAVGAWTRRVSENDKQTNRGDKPVSAEVVMTTGIEVNRVAMLAWAIMLFQKRVASEQNQHWLGELGRRVCLAYPSRGPS